MVPNNVYAFLLQAPIPTGPATLVSLGNPVIAWMVYGALVVATAAVLWSAGRPRPKRRPAAYRRPLRSVPNRGIMTPQQA